MSVTSCLAPWRLGCSPYSLGRCGAGGRKHAAFSTYFNFQMTLRAEGHSGYFPTNCTPDTTSWVFSLPTSLSQPLATASLLSVCLQDLPVLGVLDQWTHRRNALLHDWLLSLSVFSEFIHIVLLRQVTDIKQCITGIGKSLM